MRRKLKSSLTSLLSLYYRATSGLRRNLENIRNHALLSSKLTIPLDASVVVLGPVEVHGTGMIRIGRDALLYPALYFETEESGTIQIGHEVVLSRGVHIVSRESVTIGDGTMIGEYTSIRDSNHVRLLGLTIRNSGHVARPIAIGTEVWIGRGVTVLGGVAIGDGATIGANAVVTRDVSAGVTVVGVPARAVGGVKPVDHGR
jgi:acetyltransferase-like isoleucine patch superfamily enzyme